VNPLRLNSDTELQSVPRTKAEKENAIAPPAFFGSSSIDGDLRNPQSVRNWVLKNVPCFAGPVPREWTTSIYAELRKYGVKTDTISVGLALAKQDGYVFYDGYINPYDYDLRPSSSPPPPTMSAAPPATINDIKRQAVIIDGKYEIARINHNTAQMETLANMLLELLRGYLKTRQDKDRMDQVREEILQNARNIAPIIRRVERDGPAPGPGGRTVRRVGLHEYVLEDAEESEGEEAD